MADEFEAPDKGNAPAQYDGKVKLGHGRRYELPHPVTGKTKLFTRVSTIAKTIADTWYLTQWEMRMVAKGMSLRPDLMEIAQSLDVTDDRKALQNIATAAKEAAGGSVGANLGTALHAHAERLDSGEDMSKVRLSSATAASLAAYTDTLRQRMIWPVPELTEKVVINKEFEVVGRMDRGLDCQWWPLPRIGDLKTQKTMDFGGLEIAIQLALYGNADLMWNEETAEWEPFPEMDKQWAMVMHLPVGKKVCELYNVPIDEGWTCVRLAMYVREARKRGKGFLTPYVDDYQWRARIGEATSVADLSAVWHDAQAANEWSRELEKLGMMKRAEIQAQDNIDSPQIVLAIEPGQD